jgi:molybdopterin molybdotransferase
MRPGDTVLVSGTNIGAGQVGVLSALGLSDVSVHRPAQVALLANGDELAPIDRFSEVQSGDAIPETNTHGVGAAIREIGAVPQRLGIALDTEESVEQHLNLALDSRADVLLTLAGASMGETDLVKRVLDQMGFELDFWRVQMRPGSPFSFGLLPRTDGRSPLPVFGLPGNPASAFVTFHVLVRPFLLALAGHSRMFAPVVGARAGTVLRAAPHLAQFVRVRLEGSGHTTRAFQAGPQGSGLVRGMGQADGLAVVPEDVAQIGVGEPVSVILLGTSRGWSQDAGYVASST